MADVAILRILLANYAVILADLAEALQDELGKIKSWCGRWTMSLNVDMYDVVVYVQEASVSCNISGATVSALSTHAPESVNDCRSGLERNCARWRERRLRSST